MSEENIPLSEKVGALRNVAGFRPIFTLGIIGLSLIVAVLEGVGMGFILPIIEIAQNGPGDASGMSRMFLRVYQTLGIPFNLGYIVLGVGFVIAIRYTLSFLVSWAGAKLRFNYVETLRRESFESALNAQTSYFDKEGSDEILNAIITQTQYAGNTINQVIRVMELSLISIAYILIALVVAPRLTLITGAVVGAAMVGVRYLIESGYDVGQRVAEGNERVQESVQAGMQGIRDVKLFNLQSELYSRFSDAIRQYTKASVSQKRNKQAINNINQFLTAGSVFALIYVGLVLVDLSLGELGVFLFVMFRLGPKVSNLNNELYGLESQLPHLVRTQKFVGKLSNNEEPEEGQPLGKPIEEVTFDNVRFSYGDEEEVLKGVSFDVERGEFIAFVGPSGAGKSTIVSLLARMYEPDSGTIKANETQIVEFDIGQWRERIAVIRQDPFIFNDTLWNNLTVGNRDATESEVDAVCDIAQIDEFLDELPEGYDTELGDQGVRLSGGQKQRVAIARGLLKDADVLVLDEATSDLDSQLEERVHQGISELDREYITIAIAHRLSTVTEASRIYTLEDGVITETGKHEELIKNDGRYAELYTIQRSAD